MKSSLRSAAALLFGLLLAAPPPLPVSACGYRPLEARFTYPYLPGESIDDFLGGRLGILFESLLPRYDYVAWRHLSGLGMNARSRESYESSYPRAVLRTGYTHPLQMWRKARRKVEGVRDLPWFSVSRLGEKKRGEHVVRFGYINCNDDAFVHAARTLEERIGRYGPGSERVKRWLLAQDEVFSNCGRDQRAVPEPPSGDWDPLDRADRDYQVAAALFYTGDFDAAEEAFRRIAADGDSPWSGLADYVVGRVLIRRATIGGGPAEELYARADGHLREVMEDPARERYHASAARLRQYLQLRIDPDRKLRELTGLLGRKSLDPPLRQSLTDLFWLLGRKKDPGGPEGGEMAEWLLVMNTGHARAGSLARERWRQRNSPLWLAAALAKSGGGDEGLAPLLESAARVKEGSPLYLTAAYHRARLLLAGSGTGDARRLLEKVLEGSRIAVNASDRNRFMTLRRSIAADLGEFLRYAQMKPVEYGHNYGRSRALVAAGEQDALKPGKLLLDDDAKYIVNRHFTPALMLEAVESGLLDEDLARRFALAGWTRAHLLDAGEASDLARVAVRLEPVLASELGDYLSSPAGGEREFSGALTLLRHPGLRPHLRSAAGRRTPIEKRDRLRDNWWCRSGVYFGTETTVPDFIVKAGADSARMEKKFREVGADTDYFGRVVLAWAESHPDDPRLPEALHRVVRVTRFGCGGGGEISKKAFRLLHRRYPGSPWTGKTKYWYN